MKLVSTQFYDPEPITDSYALGYKEDEGYIYDEHAYNRDHSEWKLRQVKPREMPYPNNALGQTSDEFMEWSEKRNYYESHRLRYERFDEVDGWFSNDQSLCVRFIDELDKVCIEWVGDEIFYGHCSVELFELICKENGITLTTIE